MKVFLGCTINLQDKRRKRYAKCSFHHCKNQNLHNLLIQVSDAEISTITLCHDHAVKMSDKIELHYVNSFEKFKP